MTCRCFMCCAEGTMHVAGWIVAGVGLVAFSAAAGVVLGMLAGWMLGVLSP